ncbi:MAG: hypothetical protein J6T10_24840 [Methanobrevibacter sp.]|nr:hypothetical protein [Methanobrevibacter sp.]
MNKIILYVGLNDKELCKQIIETEKAVDIITRDMFSCGIDGATISRARGIWNGSEPEVTIMLTLCGVDIKKVYTLCELLKVDINQACIMVEEYNEVNIKFI